MSHTDSGSGLDLTDTTSTAPQRTVTRARTSRWHRISAVVAASAFVAIASDATPARATTAAVAPARVTSSPEVSNELLDSLRGRSRKLLARFVTPSRRASVPVLRDLFGDSVNFQFITMRPFADKVRGRIGSYRIGFFPGEQRAIRSDAYANPEGFVEITPNNQDTPISENFRLRDFLTHDQGAVWPKYAVIREPLVDKLELVMLELRGMGVPVNRMRVMSGFRTPQYNAQGVGAGGRVQDSRHQFGDAADVYIVNGSRDWMSDLDGNGRVDLRDARLLASAAERVERAHPELVGGIGVYPATKAHGPFVHIDVRGTRARWGAL